MKSPAPALEWITDRDTPNATHLYKNGQWFGSVGKSQILNEWDLSLVTNGNPRIVGHTNKLEDGKIRIERMARR